MKKGDSTHHDDCGYLQQLTTDKRYYNKPANSSKLEKYPTPKQIQAGFSENIPSALQSAATCQQLQRQGE
jgi:hypothetical protein